MLLPASSYSAFVTLRWAYSGRCVNAHPPRQAASAGLWMFPEPKDRVSEKNEQEKKNRRQGQPGSRVNTHVRGHHFDVDGSGCVGELAQLQLAV